MREKIQKNNHGVHFWVPDHLSNKITILGRVAEDEYVNFTWKKKN